MKINEYQRLAAVTRNMELNKNDSLLNAAFGLIGESGEVIDLIKKHLCQGHEINKEKLKSELGDIAWYIALTCTILQFDLDKILNYDIPGTMVKLKCIKDFENCKAGENYYFEIDWMHSYYDSNGNEVGPIPKDFELHNDYYKQYFSQDIIFMTDFNEYKSFFHIMCYAIKDFSHKSNLIDFSFDLIDKSYQVSSVIKDYLTNNPDLDTLELKIELSNAFMGIAYMSEILELDLEEILIGNIDKLKSRYPEGFSTLASINREEYSK